MLTTDKSSKSIDSQADPRPFRPSWIDFFVNRIEKLPIPTWVFYLVFLILTGLLNNLVMWLGGALEFGRIDWLFSFAAIYIIYSLGFYHYLRRVASRSLHDFYPVSDAALRKEEELEFRMTNLPAGMGWLALVLGMIMGPFDAYASYSMEGDMSVIVFIYSSIATIFGYGFFFALLFLTSKQIFTIITLHQKVRQVDLFNLAPLRAFSRLTATAGIGIFIIGAISALIYSESADPSLIIFYVGIVLSGILIFIIPLISLRTQINKEKKQRILESDQRMKHILEDVKRSIQKGELAGLGELNTTIAILEKEKAILKGISSYPWNPGIFRSFISTILLPILLWWIKSLLERWL
jgi:hypothetical protein